MTGHRPYVARIPMSNGRGTWAYRARCRDCDWEAKHEHGWRIDAQRDADAHTAVDPNSYNDRPGYGYNPL